MVKILHGLHVLDNMKSYHKIAKEFANVNGINVAALSKTCTAKQECRDKKKFPGNAISVLIPPTQSFVKEEGKKLVLYQGSYRFWNPGKVMD